MQIVNSGQLLLCGQPERAPGASLRRTMREVAESLVKQRFTAIPAHCFRRREQIFEHDRTSSGMNTSPIRQAANLCGVTICAEATIPHRPMVYTTFLRT